MSGVITGLKFQQRDKSRVSVYLDGEYAFALDAIEAARLRKGQVLSDTEIASLRAQDERQRAYDRAVRFLSYRPRSRAEVERYLRGKAIAEEVVVEVIARLERAGYLDDEAFARFWLENRERFKPRSQRALQYELRQKGVGDEIIARVLSDADDETSAWHAIEGRFSKWADLPVDEFRQKVVDYLYRRGFDYSTISVTLEKALRKSGIEN
ncbi:MAG: RecX family transcriptional regulator [Anaerolineae bacterium]